MSEPIVENGTCKRCGRKTTVLSNGLCSRCDNVLYGKQEKELNPWYPIKSNPNLLNPHRPKRKILWCISTSGNFDPNCNKYFK